MQHPYTLGEVASMLGFVTTSLALSPQFAMKQVWLQLLLLLNVHHYYYTLPHAYLLLLHLPLAASWAREGEGCVVMGTSSCG